MECKMSLHPGNHDTSEASHRKQRFHYDGKFLEKKEVVAIDLARNGNPGCANEILGCAKCHF